MIVFIHTEEHAYTHHCLVGADPDLKFDFLHYSALAHLRSLPRATYIFTDLDRLPTQTLRLAATLYRQLRDRGIKVLNDPAKVLSRSGLLRALFLKGINRFDAYRVEEGRTPKRWPVFLRTDGEHVGPIATLYERAEDLEQGIANAVSEGLPKSRLLIVEYMAEPVRPGLFRKLSGFRIASTSVPYTCVHDTSWIAKQGQLGITPPELYQQELDIVRSDPYGPKLAEGFDLAGLDYGRADFGLVDGQIQIYEINSNPVLHLEANHPSLVRLESYRVFKRNYLAALRKIDS